MKRFRFACSLLMFGLVTTMVVPQHTMSTEDLSVVPREATATQNCIPPPAGLVAWYPGDGNANDIQGGNHGALQNGATFAAGIVGQAFSFDGSDDHTRIANSANLNPGSITVDAWINPRSATNNDIPSIVVKFDNILSPSYSLTLGGTGWGGGIPNTITAWVNTAAGVTGVRTATAVPLNVWSHVAMTYDAATSALRVYINGLEFQRHLLLVVPPTGVSPPVLPLRLLERSMALLLPTYLHGSSRG
jgi:hypothetical protein